jgi:hypothetical protein
MIPKHQLLYNASYLDIPIELSTVQNHLSVLIALFHVSNWSISLSFYVEIAINRLPSKKLVVDSRAWIKCIIASARPQRCETRACDHRTCTCDEPYTPDDEAQPSSEVARPSSIEKYASLKRLIRSVLDSMEVIQMSPTVARSMAMIQMTYSIDVALHIYYFYLLIRSIPMLLINQARPQLTYLGPDVVAASRCS